MQVVSKKFYELVSYVSPGLLITEKKGVFMLPKQKCIFLINWTTLARTKLILNMEDTSWCKNDTQYSLNSGIIQVNPSHIYVVGGQGDRSIPQTEMDNNFQ